MSAMPLRAPARPGPAESGRSWQQEVLARRAAALGRLRVVRAPAQPQTRLPFVVVCLTLLAAALMGALLLNTAMAQTAFDMQAKQIELARLTERQQDLTQQLEIAASPQALAERARAMGMVPAPAPAFVDLTEGAIVGESVPARVG
jgi:hypothetical protein